MKKDECIILANMKHSQPHVTLFWVVTCLSWGRNMLRKVESMMMMLSYASLAFFSPPSYGGISILLFISLTDTCSKNFGSDCGSALSSIDSLRL